MKKIIILLPFIFAGCICENKKEIKITAKFYTDYYGSPIKNGVCRYFYTNGNWPNYEHQFQDSCNKYNVSDILKSSK